MRRVVFNIAEFIEELQWVLEDYPELIDDTVQKYKDFLSRTKEPLLFSIKKYAINHPLVVENKRLRSFILACH